MLFCKHPCLVSIIVQNSSTACGSSGAGSDTLYVTDAIRKSSEGQKDCPVTITERQFCVQNQKYTLWGKAYFVICTALNYYVIGIIYSIFMALWVYGIWVCSNNFTYLGKIVFYMMI